MKKLFIVLAFFFIFIDFPFYSASKIQKQLPFSKGVNMPVWMEGSRLNTALYGKKDFENAKSLGVEVIRLPVWFEIWNEGAPEYKVTPECFEIIDNAISWCEELGMYLIIDFHNDCNGTSKTNPKIEQILLKVWPQIANRYKDKGETIIYEIMNEPHFSTGNLKADCTKWAKIQGNVLKVIRDIDQKHYVIAGGGDWDSIDSMLALPDYKDDKLIYNFHDYSPYLFTHQGAPWTYLKRITHIPFPYAKDKMPALPKNPTAEEKREWTNYEKASSEETLCTPLDKAVEFANKRGAALMCNEFGVSLKYADPTERVNWYRIKCGWMDERNICRVSWDYTQEFGLFKSTSETRFPEDINTPLIQAMGYKVPSGKSTSWIQNAQKTGDYTIYKNGNTGLLRSYGSGASGSLAFKDGNEKYIVLKDIQPYAGLNFEFGEAVNLSSLKDGGAALELAVKTKDKNLTIDVYFRNAETKTFPWRASTTIQDKIKPDGEWHKIIISFKDFNDIGGWANGEWKNSEGKFDWTVIDSLIFQSGATASKEGFAVKDIRIVK